MPRLYFNPYFNPYFRWTPGPLQRCLKIFSTLKIVCDVLGIAATLYVLFRCISREVTQPNEAGSLPVVVCVGSSLLFFVLSIADFVLCVLLLRTLSLDDSTLQDSVCRLWWTFGVLVVFDLLFFLCAVFLFMLGSSYAAGAAWSSACLSLITASLLFSFIRAVKAAPPNLPPPPSSLRNRVFGQPTPSTPYVFIGH